MLISILLRYLTSSYNHW